MRVFTQDDCGGEPIDSSVRLVEDVDCSGIGNAAITAGAGGIRVDLAGHTLTGAYGSSVVYTNGYAGVVVSGGTIVVGQYGTGVDLERGADSSVENVTFLGGGSGTGVGVYCYGAARARVSNVVASWLESGIYSNYCTISISSATLTDSLHGLYSYQDTAVTASGVTASRNRYGIYDWETARFTLSRSVADSNGFGIYLYPNGEGTVSVTGSSAILSSYTGFYDEWIQMDDGIGLVLYGGYDYSGNRNTITSSVASHNDAHGFFLYYPGATTFKGNTAEENGWSGVYVYEAYGYYGPIYGSNNVANENGSYGFYSDYAVFGSGNRMAGNDYDPECPGWVCTVSTR